VAEIIAGVDGVAPAYDSRRCGRSDARGRRGLNEKGTVALKVLEAISSELRGARGVKRWVSGGLAAKRRGMKKPTVIATLSFFAALGLCAVGPVGANPPGRPVSPPRSTVIDGDAEADLLAVQDLPAVSVSIDRKKAAPFVVDWAANLLAMSPSFGRELGLAPFGKDEMGNDAVAVKSLSIGGAVFRGLVAAEDPFLEGRSERGVLGVNVFANAVVTLDFVRKKIVFTRERLPEPDGKYVLPVTLAEGGAPLVPILICGKPVKALVDTAAPAQLRITAGLLKTLHCESTGKGSVSVVGAQSGQERPEQVRLMGDVRVGRVTFVRPKCLVGADGRVFIGAGMLQRYAVTLDLRSRRFRISGPGRVTL
jgi:hypothetical protein